MADLFALDPTSLGQINEAGDELALFLKLFSGEVLLELEPRLTTMGTVMRKTVKPGAKSAQFRLMGSGRVTRHVAGLNILTDDDPDSAGATKMLAQINQGEREVFLDRPLIVPTTVDDWEEMRNSFSSRQPIARVLARDLAERIDSDRLRLMIRAAAGSLTSTSSFPTEWNTSGTVITDVNSGTDGSALLDTLRQVEEAFSNENVPDEERHVALNPARYNLLVQNQDLLNRDFGNQNGIFSEGSVFKAWGMMLHKTTNVPTTDDEAASAVGVFGEDYNVDATNTVAICWQEEGFATVEASAISIQAENMIELQGTLILAKVINGHDVLRPDHFAQVKTA